MTGRAFLAASLGLALAWSAPTPATAIESNRLGADMRCLVASLTLITSSDPEQQRAGFGSFAYWLGRVDGAAPTINLEEEIATLAQSMTQEDVSHELVRCGGELQARGQQVTELGNRLSARGF
ncbi:MAG: hypothetical protein R3C16_10410 [Hyphomonadaceae bacterium]